MQDNSPSLVGAPTNYSLETGGNLASLVSGQTTGNSSLATLAGAVTAAKVQVNVTNTTVAITASSLPLPTGAATETTVAAINTKTPALGQAVAASSVPVVLPATQITSLTPPAAITNYANETGGNLATIVTNTGRIPAQGQAAMAASTPVVIANNQTAVPVSGTFWQATQPVSGTVTANAGSGTQAVSAASLPLPSGASTSALQTTGNSSLSSIDGKTPALGQAVSASSVPVVLPAAQITTLTPPAAITGFALDATLTSGNQRVQGNVASAATDSGNPLKIGLKYNSTLPTVTDGQRVDAQGDANGRTIVTVGTLMSGENQTADTMGITDKPVNDSTYAPANYQMPASPVAAQNVKGSDASIYSIMATNTNAALRWLQIFNTTTAPSASDPKFKQWPIPAGTANAPGTLILDKNYFATLLKCSTGLTFGFSTTKDTYTAATAADHFIDINYK